MLNEGIVTPDSRQLMKTEMIRELHELGGATPSHWQEAVFKRFTGEDFSELDWDFEGNQKGAFLWRRSASPLRSPNRTGFGVLRVDSLRDHGSARGCP